MNQPKLTLFFNKRYLKTRIQSRRSTSLGSSSGAFAFSNATETEMSSNGSVCSFPATMNQHFYGRLHRRAAAVNKMKPKVPKLYDTWSLKLKCLFILFNHNEIMAIVTMIYHDIWSSIFEVDVTFSLSRSWMWVDQLLGLAGAARELSFSFACPFHCGQSSTSYFLFGFTLGLLLGLLLAAYLALLLRGFSVSQVAEPPRAPTPGPTGQRPRSRIGRYLDEW